MRNWSKQYAELLSPAMPQMSKDETRLKEWLKDIRSIEKELNRQG